MTEALDRLRKVLALERQRKFADTVVIGGLDSFLLRFVQDEGIPHSHAFSRVLQSLPPGGYHALHQIQRRTVVNALLDAVKDGLPAAGRIKVFQLAPATHLQHARQGRVGAIGDDAPAFRHGAY